MDYFKKEYIKYFIPILFISFIIQEVKSQEINENTFKPSGEVLAEIFGDFAYVVKADSGAVHLNNAVLNKNENYNAFIFRCFHLGYQYNFTPKISARFRTDVDENSLTSDGKFSLFVKDAWIKWNAFKNHDIIFGIQDVLQLSVCENAWGNRYLEKSISDLRGLVGGHEFGVSLKGNHEKIDYGIMLANGTGLNPTADKYKRLFLNTSYKPAKEAFIQIYTDCNFKEKFNDLVKNELSAGAVLGYTFVEKYTIGIDGFIRNAKNNYFSENTYSDLNTYAISSFAYAKINPIHKIIMRFDYFEPNNEQIGDVRNNILFAYEISPIPNFQISPNILIENYEKTTLPVMPSVWARLTLHWSIN